MLRRRAFTQATGALFAALASVRPSRAVSAMLRPPDAFESMKRLRLAYMQAAGDPRRRFAINRQLIGLAFEMKNAGAPRAHIRMIAQKSLLHAKQEYNLA
jgi:hypothetical protein